MAISYKSRLFFLGVLVLVLASVPIWGSDYIIYFSIISCLYLAMAQAWNLLIGYSGLLSLGQQAFIGIGGYAVAVMTSYYNVHIWVSIFLGGLFSVLLSLFMSLFIFRMRGIFFGIGTWVFAEGLLIWFSNWKYIKYGMGMFINPSNPPSMTHIFYASLIAGVGSVVLVLVILRSKLGLGLMAMRDDEEVSETMGVEVFKSKLYCFLLSAFITGTASGLLHFLQVFVRPNSAFAIGWMVKLIFIVIIGGIGTMEGPIVGSLIFVFLTQWLSEYYSTSMVILGVIAITVMLAAPKGIVGTLQEKYGFEILSSRWK